MEKKILLLGDGLTSSELCDQAKFAEVSAQAADFIMSPTFRMASEPEEVEIVCASFGGRPTNKKVLDWFEEFNLDRPTEEDALRFAGKYPKEYLNRPIVFLHTDNPWRARHSFSIGDALPHVLVLGTSRLRPALYCHQSIEDDDDISAGWFSTYRFAARVRH